MENMERLLTTWIEDQTHQTTLYIVMVKVKAQSLWDSVKIKRGPEETGAAAKAFKASHGWFQRFKQCSNLHNLHLVGEEGEAFPDILKARIEEGGYFPKQVINIDETGLFWKKMPSCTFITREEKSVPRFKAAKDRLTLLLVW